MATKKVDPLINWTTLNAELMKLTDDAAAKKLLERELKLDRPRSHYALRIFSRFSQLRRDRERRELLAVLAGNQ